MSDLADELLQAHVQHELSRLQGEALGQRIDENVASVFRWMEDITLNDVVTPEQIAGVIDRYVIELRVSGGITELAGQMSSVIFSSRASATTRVEDILPADAYEEFADKILSLHGVQREVVRYLARSSAFRGLTCRLVTRSLMTLLFRSGRERGHTALSETLRSWIGERVLPVLEGGAQAALTHYVERRAERVTKDVEEHALDVVDPEMLRQVADEIWDAVAHQPLAEAAPGLTVQDIEDFVVLSYEFWLKFRKTPYFRTVSMEVVEQLFRKYGDETLASLVEDMGVTEQMVAGELRTFARPLLDRARSTGFLEERIRAVLEPFYRSDAARAILAAR